MQTQNVWLFDFKEKKLLEHAAADQFLRGLYRKLITITEWIAIARSHDR